MLLKLLLNEAQFLSYGVLLPATPCAVHAARREGAGLSRVSFDIVKDRRTGSGMLLGDPTSRRVRSRLAAGLARA
jgi:hypothetical protein